MTTLQVITLVVYFGSGLISFLWVMYKLEDKSDWIAMSVTFIMLGPIMTFLMILTVIHDLREKNQ